MAIDLRQVAERAGVSASTASRALSGSSKVATGTRERVLAAARQLGYRPNAMARGLRTARSRLIGLVITQLTNESFHLVAAAVQRRLIDGGYQMVLSVTGGDAEHERLAAETLVDHNVDGVIMVGSDARAIAGLRRHGVPVVHLARRPDSPVGDCVLGDELGGAREATSYLIDCGHRRIAVIAGPHTITSGQRRLDGYRLAMARAGVEVDDALVVTGPYEPATGEEAFEAIWRLPPDRRPTALLIADQPAVRGTLAAMRTRGIRIPDELSVICYEDAELLRWWQPALSVVDNNAYRLGELAASVLIDRLGSTTTSAPVDYHVGAKLVIRDSCAALGS